MTSQKPLWRDAIIRLLDRALANLKPGSFSSSMPDLALFLPPDQAKLAAAHPIYGTALLAIDAFFDAAAHNFPDMGEGIPLAQGEQLIRKLRDHLLQQPVTIPPGLRPFANHLPFRL